MATLQDVLSTAIQQALQKTTEDLALQMLEAVTTKFDPFFEAANERFGVASDELKDLFMETMKSLQLGKVVAKPKTKAAAAADKEDEVRCDFTMTGRSKRAGEQCGAKVTTPNATRCKRHMNASEAKPTAPKKTTTTTTTKTKAKVADTKPVVKTTVDTSPEVVSEQEQLVLPNKWGNYMDNDTKFVFANGSTVYGKQDMTTGKVLALNEEEQALCESSEWTYDPDARNEETAVAGPSGSSDDADQEPEPEPEKPAEKPKAKDVEKRAEAKAAEKPTTTKKTVKKTK